MFRCGRSWFQWPRAIALACSHAASSSSPDPSCVDVTTPLEAAGKRVLGGDDAPAGANTDAKPKAHVQRCQEAKLTHEAAVMPRVPRDSRHAQAWEMDRNTDQTSSTHQHGAGKQDEPE